MSFQPLEIPQPRVGDLGARQRERLQLGHPLEMDQPGVGDFGAGDGVDFKHFTLIILPDEGSQLLQRRNSVVATLIQWNVRWLLR